MAVDTLPSREQSQVSGLADRNRRLQSTNDRLEQELERLGEKNVELAFQLVEMEQRLRAAADLQIEKANQLRAEYQGRIAELEEQLRLRDLEQPPSNHDTLHRIARHLEPLLGAAATHLVERIFQRAGVDPASQSLDQLEPALVRLEEAAGRLLAAPERARELRDSLRALRQTLGFQPPSSPEPEAEPWRFQPENHPDEPLRTDLDPELGSALITLREQIQAGEQARALEAILSLRALYPHSLEAAELHFLSLVALRHDCEALELGRRLAPSCRSDEAFVEAFTRLLEDPPCKSAQERKQVLLDLVELHLEDTQRALGYLRRAELLPDRCAGCERLDFHAVGLLAGRREDRRPYLLAYMGWLDRPEVFEHLWQVYNEPRSPHEASAARAIVALGKVSRKLAENSEKQARLLARALPEPLEGPGEVEEAACIRFLDGLFQQAGLGSARPSSNFLRRLENGHTPEPGWLSLPDPARFGLTGAQVARYAGPERFLVDSHCNDSGQATLVVHACVALLPEAEQAYLLHRALYQLARGHAALRHRRANLSTSQVRRLVQACRSWLSEHCSELPEVSSDPLYDLRALCLATRNQEASYLLEFLTHEHPFADQLDRPADHYARCHSSLTGASYALLREQAPELLPQVEREGFRALYEQTELGFLRLRLQRLWAEPLKQALRE